MLPAQLRAPSVATLTETGSGGWRTGQAMAHSTFDAAKATREHYLCNTYLYAAIQALGEDLASLTLRIGENPDRPQDFIEDHPLIARLGTGAGVPNPQATAAQLWQWTVAQFVINGRFAWEVDPTDLTFWPLIAHRVEPIASNGGDKYFSEFRYDIGQGKKRRLPADRVVYHWRPSQTDWRQPESVLQAARLDLSVAVMQDLYDYAFLQNDARPAAVIVHEQFDDVNERDAWRRDFLDTHQGARNAGKAAFVQTREDGAPPKDALFVQTLGLSQKDAEFIRRYEAKIRSILLAVGTPLARLGDPTAATYANAHEAMKAYWKNKVRNLAISMANALNQHVLPLYGGGLRVWWDFSENEYLREPPKFTITDGLAALAAGVVTPEEVRVEAMGLPEVPLIGTLETGTPEAPDAPDDDDEATVLPFAADALAATIQAAVDAAFAARATPAVPETPVADTTAAEDGAERRERQWRAFDSSTGALERRWSKRWQRLFDRQQDAVLARLNGKRGRQALRAPEDPDVDALFDDAFWFGETADLARDLYEDVVGASFAAFEGSVGIAFDVEAPFAQGFIESRANQLAGQVTQTTYDAIKAQLAEGALAGESIPDIAGRIEHLFQQTYANRAVTVARTEVISGYNGGTREAALQTDGVVESLEWIATRDNRTRDAHRSADGQVVPIGEQFDVGGERLEYPGDPNGRGDNTVNCRCAVAPVVAEDAARGSNVIEFDRAARLAIAVARGDLRVHDHATIRRALGR